MIGSAAGYGWGGAERGLIRNLLLGNQLGHIHDQIVVGPGDMPRRLPKLTAAIAK